MYCRFVYIFVLLLFWPSDLRADALVEERIRVGAEERSYLIATPETGAHKLLLVLHGGGQGAQKMARTKIHLRALPRGYAVVYPQAIGRNWNDGRRKGFPQHARADDVQFLKQLIHALRNRLSIAKEAVFVTGPSNGGMMSFRLACDAASTIAGVAPVIASMPEDYLAHCKPSRGVPMLVIAGEADPMVPYEGGAVRAFGRTRGHVVSVLDAMSFWLRNNSCAERLELAQRIDRLRDEDTSVSRFRGRDCRRGPVELYTVHGGGHRWFGPVIARARLLTNALMGGSSEEIDTTSILLDFFDSLSP